MQRVDLGSPVLIPGRGRALVEHLRSGSKNGNED